MVDLKRTIAGVRIIADTEDREKAAKVQKILDTVMKSHADARKAKADDRTADWFRDLLASVR
jgi:hypothetical protein